jgi:pSer/pThr/pTyr-binding forkhead associated (FHA) protein
MAKQLFAVMFVVKILYKGETKTIESEKPELVVGRSTPAKEVDIDLTPDKMVSRSHLVLKMEYNMGSGKNEAWVHDQGSSRGTLLNGIPVIEPIKLEPDDRIEIGESVINVRLKAKPKPKKDMSFQEKVSARTGTFGETLPSSETDIETTPPPSDIETTPPPIEEDNPIISSRDEVTLGVPSLLLNSDSIQTECAGFVAYSVEDLAMAVNRYSRQNKMHPISSSIVQEGKGSSACFRAMVVFHVPPTN